MSTYYGFCCDKCKVTGGFFSRQAWGYGNFDIIDSFKFIAYHTSECGHSNIRIVSEHDEESGWPDCNSEDEARADFLENTKNYFPRSDDWKFVNDNVEDINEKWVEKEKKEIHRPE